MAGFYKPFTIKIEKPLIIYPCIGLEKVLDRKDIKSISNHLEKLYSNNKVLKVGTYHIIILWDEITDNTKVNNIDIMTDVWIFDKVDSWGSGPLVDVKIFRNLEIESAIGVSAGDGLLMLGREEELRRNSSSLENYLNDKRAILPADLVPTESFFTK